VALPGQGVPRGGFAKKHDLIFRCAKGTKPTFNVDAVRIPYSEDSSARLRYKAEAFRSSGTYDRYEQNPKGRHPENRWTIQPVMPSSKVRTGFPTQKPLPLYERMILASPNGDSGAGVVHPGRNCPPYPETSAILLEIRLAADLTGSLAVVRHPKLTPQNQMKSTGSRADQRRTLCAERQPRQQ